MERNINLDEISDGKLYGANDMVRADCGNCEGCWACCEGMGKSIILDPLDVYRLTRNEGMTFEQLMADKIELGVVDSIILPNLRMTGEKEQCVFLDSAGRCSIHPFRPGFCRLFPLGRLYEDRSFRYFLQVHECIRENRSKVKVRKWIDTPDIKDYEKYICDWHYLLKDLEQGIKAAGNENLMKAVDMYILNHFYVQPYEEEGFYPQFYSRWKDAVLYAVEQGIQVKAALF